MLAGSKQSAAPLARLWQCLLETANRDRRDVISVSSYLIVSRLNVTTASEN